MQELGQIAYATIIYEKHVLEILPKERRTHEYCRPNTNVSPALIRIFEGGRSKTSYEKAIRNVVLWNFKNLETPGSGTIEFRGLPGVHSGQETIHWILFAVGFILLAVEEVCVLMYGLGRGECAFDTFIG